METVEKKVKNRKGRSLTRNTRRAHSMSRFPTPQNGIQARVLGVFVFYGGE